MDAKEKGVQLCLVGKSPDSFISMSCIQFCGNSRELRLTYSVEICYNIPVMKRDKFTEMTEGSVKLQVCKMAVPTIITMLITSIYNMADTYFVGKLGTSATGGVGVVFSYMAVIQAIGFFFGHGSGNYISRKLGEKKPEDSTVMAATGFFTSFAFGVLIAVLTLIFLSPICRILGATETILPYAKDYLFYILLAVPFMMGALTLNNQLRFQGNANIGMVGMVSGGILNMALDPLFIFIFDMGISGAGCATMISQIVSFLILIIGCTRFSQVKISIRNFSFGKHWYFEIFRGGVPSLCRQGLGSISGICLNNMAKPFGDPAIAAISVVTKISMFIVSALIGFGQGFQPVCGFNYGAKKYDRVREAFWFSVKVAFVFLVIAGVIAFLFAPEVILLFTKNDAKVLEIGTLALRFQCIVLPVNSFVILANMLLQTMGRAIPATIVAMARQFLCFLPVLFIAVPLLGLLGIQLTQPLADLLAVGVAIPFTCRELRKLKTEQSI